MKQVFYSLSPSDTIQLLGIVASLITSLAAIIISLMTLRQNSKMIEDASRPVISIYGECINVGPSTFYIVIKNFGSSPAYITQFDYDFDFTSAYLKYKGKQGLVYRISRINGYNVLAYNSKASPLVSDAGCKSSGIHIFVIVLPLIMFWENPICSHVLNNGNFQIS